MFKTVSTLLAALLCLMLFSEIVCAGQVNIFIYHRFDESLYPSTNISSDIFKQQLDHLKAENYQVLSLGEVVRRIRQGEPLPEKGAALCADDAYHSFAAVALPVLRQYGFPMTLFVNTDAVGSNGYLDWETLKALSAEGVEIGNHTASHPYLVEKEPGEDMVTWRQRVTADIAKAQGMLKEHLKIEPTLFAYTFGEYSDEVIEIVQQFGFQAAFAQQSGVVHENNDLFTLPRFPMGGGYATLEGFKNKLTMKPLIVLQEEPTSPVLDQAGPPELLLQLDVADVDLRQMNCFVQGENSCRVEAVSGRAGWFRVIAEEPLSGRRNKYTLTVAGKKGGWHWYSHPWLNAKSPALEIQRDNGEISATNTEAGVGETNEAVGSDQ